MIAKKIIWNKSKEKKKLRKNYKSTDCLILIVYHVTVLSIYQSIYLSIRTHAHKFKD